MPFCWTWSNWSIIFNIWRLDSNRKNNIFLFISKHFLDAILSHRGDAQQRACQDHIYLGYMWETTRCVFVRTWLICPMIWRRGNVYISHDLKYPNHFIACSSILNSYHSAAPMKPQETRCSIYTTYVTGIYMYIHIYLLESNVHDIQHISISKTSHGISLK